MSLVASMSLLGPCGLCPGHNQFTALVLLCFIDIGCLVRSELHACLSMLSVSMVWHGLDAICVNVLVCVSVCVDMCMHLCVGDL